MLFRSQLSHRIIYRELGNSYELKQKNLSGIIEELAAAYPGQKKGVFISSDTDANIFLNLLIKKYGTLPDDYLIVGFDDSPIAREAVIPISTVGQQIDRIAYEAVSLLVDQMNERKKRRSKQSFACLASRFVYGEEITRELLSMCAGDFDGDG